MKKKIKENKKRKRPGRPHFGIREVFNNYERNLILTYLTNHQCSSVTKIQQDTGIERGNLKYHLKLLKKFKMISYRTDRKAVGKPRVISVSKSGSREHLKRLKTIKSKLLNDLEKVDEILNNY